MVVAATSIIAVAGCSNTGRDRAETVEQPDAVSTVQQDQGRKLTAEQARSALLTVTDLPTGWSAKPDTDTAKKDSSGDYQECPKLAAVFKELESVDDISADFTSSTGSDVSEAIMPVTVSAAERLVTEFSEAVTTCKVLSTQTDSGMPFDMYLTALSFPKLADETFAFRTTAALMGATVNADMALVRRNGVLIFIVQTAAEQIDTGATEDVARRALTKVDENLR